MDGAGNGEVLDVDEDELDEDGVDDLKPSTLASVAATSAADLIGAVSASDMDGTLSIVAPASLEVLFVGSAIFAAAVDVTAHGTCTVSFTASRAAEMQRS